MLETHDKKYGSKKTSKFHGGTHQSIANNRSPQRHPSGNSELRRLSDKYCKLFRPVDQALADQWLQSVPQL